MSSSEFAEWLAYYTVEPWGFEIENWRSALITSMVANTARDPKKHRKPYQPSDFIPDLDGEDKQPLSWEALKEKTSMVFASLGGRVKR